MVSQRKITANRANGRASRGPTSVEGKARSSQNARRHGLSLSVMADPVLYEEARALAREIAGGSTDANVWREACTVAEAQTDLKRISHARQQLLAGALGSAAPEMTAPNTTTVTVTEARFWSISVETLDQLNRLDRYEQRAMSRRKFAIRRLDHAIATAKRNEREYKQELRT